MTETRGRGPEQKTRSFEEGYKQLQIALDIIQTLNLTVPNYCHQPETIQKNWKAHTPFPIAREGVDGIRATFKRDGSLRIFFTNGFDNPEDPKRKTLAEKLRSEGFDVI